MNRLDRDEVEVRIGRTHAILISRGLLAAVTADTDDERLWTDCELTSMVEGRFGVVLDPQRLTANERAHWQGRAVSSEERLVAPSREGDYRRAYWIVEGGERRGTVALATYPMGWGQIDISSLYVFPQARRSGVATRALQTVKDMAVLFGLGGIRLGTHWTWQRPVRFYLGLGMWVQSWKRGPTFAWATDLPRWRVQRSGDEAQFSCPEKGGEKEEVLIRARRRGERLDWLETDDLDDNRKWLARGTFSVALAVEGWPLIRSDATWAERHHWSDGGMPDGLAYKIEIFEAIDRAEGFEVHTPRIPGLSYRDLESID